MKRIRFSKSSINESLLRLFALIKAYYFLLIIIGLFVLTFFIDLNDYEEFTYSNYNSFIALHSIIIGSLASILGIIIAIQLVIIETLKKEYTYFAVEGFLRNKYNITLIILFVLTIIISIICICFLSDPPNNNDSLRILLSILLFIICFILIFPMTREILIPNKTKTDINNLIQSIQKTDVDQYTSNTRRIIESDQIIAIEKNKIFIISEILLKSIKNSDRLLPKLIIIELSKKLVQLIELTGKGQDARSTINSFVSVYYSTFYELMQQKQFATIQVLINELTTIHMNCAKQKTKWYAMIELNEFLNEISDKLVKSQINDLGNMLIWNIERIHIEHLSKNIPKEDEIWLLQDWKNINRNKIDHDKTGQWNGIKEASTSLLYKMASSSIKYKNTEIFLSVIDALNRLPDSIIKIELGEKINNQLIRDIYMNQDYLVSQALDDNLLQTNQLLYISFYHETIVKILNMNSLYSKIPIISLSNILINFSKKGIYYYHGLNEIGTIGRILSYEPILPICKEAILFINETFHQLFEIGINNKPKAPEYYLNDIILQVESIGRDVTLDESITQKLTENLNLLKTEFSKLELPKEQIDWPFL